MWWILLWNPPPRKLAFSRKLGVHTLEKAQCLFFLSIPRSGRLLESKDTLQILKYWLFLQRLSHYCSEKPRSSQANAYLFVESFSMLACVAGGLSCGREPYWHFVWWFLWADSIRITEDFHLVGSCSHAKEVSLEHLFTKQGGFATLRGSQAKAQLPSNTLQCPPSPPTHTHTHRSTSPSGFHLVAPR